MPDDGNILDSEAKAPVARTQRRRAADRTKANEFAELEKEVETLKAQIATTETAAKEQEAQMRAIERSQATIEFDLDGTILRANKNFCDVSGYRPEDLPGTHHRQFVVPEYAASSEYSNFWKRLASGEVVAGMFKRVHKDGGQLFLKATYNPIFDESGRPYKVVKYAYDMTAETKRNADAESQMAAIRRSQAVIEFTTDGIVLDANKNFLDAVGYRLEEIKGAHHRLFVAPEERQSPEYLEFWRRLAAGEFSTGEFRRVSKSGEEIWLNASYNPVLDPNGNPVKVVKYASDISREVELRLELSQMLKQVSANAQSLNAASDDLAMVSQQMAAAAEETSVQATTVAAASEQVQQNVRTVVNGTDEMTASIRDIAQSATEAARVASSAVDVAANATATVTKLGESSGEIGKVIKVITSIAQQTNLLALNATIEAARAGEAGKGFAVVATEVKELAKETAKATEDISQKIEAIQTDTEDAVRAIAEISNIINQINDTQTTIAGAVEEQTATTNEMSRNLAEGVRGVEDITSNIAGVADAARENASGASRSFEATQALATLAMNLQTLVDNFQNRNGGAK